MIRKALYPGTFDPLTYGHLDLIQRGLRLFDQIVVAIANNPAKKPLFTVADRVDMIQVATKGLSGVEVVAFDGLLVRLAKAADVQAIIRGLRAVSDFEYELQMALINRKLSPEIETVFMIPAGKHSYLSSSIVREVASLGGCIKGFVPEYIETKLKEKLRTVKTDINLNKSGS